MNTDMYIPWIITFRIGPPFSRVIIFHWFAQFPTYQVEQYMNHLSILPTLNQLTVHGLCSGLWEMFQSLPLRYHIVLNKLPCLNKSSCSPSSFWQPTPKFWWNGHPKQIKKGVKKGEKWLKNIFVVPLGFLAPYVCLSPHRERLFSKIQCIVPCLWRRRCG